MDIKNKHICITGTLRKWSRNQAKNAVTERGAIFSNHVNTLTDFLVVADGTPMTEKIAKAIELMESGAGIRFMDEKEFYRAVKA